MHASFHDRSSIACCPPQGVEDGAEVEFEIELLSYTKHAAWVAMTPDEKLTRAEALKEQGNTTLKAGQLKHARTKYLKAMRILDQTFDFEGDSQVSSLLLVAFCFSSGLREGHSVCASKMLLALHWWRRASKCGPVVCTCILPAKDFGVLEPKRHKIGLRHALQHKQVLQCAAVIGNRKADDSTEGPGADQDST